MKKSQQIRLDQMKSRLDLAKSTHLTTNLTSPTPNCHPMNPNPTQFDVPLHSVTSSVFPHIKWLGRAWVGHKLNPN